MFFCHFNRRAFVGAQRLNQEEIIDRLFPFAKPDRCGFLEQNRVLLVQGVHFNTPFSALEPTPLHNKQHSISLVSWARLDNREELGQKTGISKGIIATLSDSELILACYLKWGEECVDHLIGDFAFVLYDEKKQTIFCGRDHFGVRPFYYFLDNNRFVCATSLNGLVGLEGITTELDGPWMAAYLHRLSKSFAQTPYVGIKKLPPGHCLTVTPEREHLHQYFHLTSEPPLHLKDSREYVDAYREQLQEAIECRLVSDYPIGSELSGGLDSSTITAFSANFLGPVLNSFHTFAITNCELEPEYVEAVRQAWALTNNHGFTAREPESPNTMRHSLAVLGYPEEYGVATCHEPFYRLAEKLNVRTMLSGFGGDEFVTTNHGNMVPLELLRQYRYGDLYHILPGNPLMRFLRLGHRIKQQIQTRNFTIHPQPSWLSVINRRWPHQIVEQEFVERFDLHRTYIDQAHFDDGYTDLKKMIIEKRWEPFVPTRMENCIQMAGARKIEYRWPLLDVRLVKLFMRIPAQENYYRGMGRYLHRRAVTGIVPDLVAWKQSKNMGVNTCLDANWPRNLARFSLDELHPALAKLIDTKKLAQQLAALAGRHDFCSNSNYWYMVRHNVTLAIRLNLWLKSLPTSFSIKF